MGVYLTVAFRNLRQGGRRTWLLGSAIGLVTMLLVVLAALASGLEATMIRSASTLMSGHVNIGGFFKVTSGNPAPLVTGRAKLRAFVEAEVEGIDLVIDRARGWGKVISEKGSLMVSMSGVDIDEEQGLRDVLQVIEGSLDDLRGEGRIVLFEGQAERLEVKVGDVITLTGETMGGVNNTLDLRVVAVVRDVGFLSAWNGFVTKEVVRRLYQLGDDVTGAIQIYLKDPSRAPGVRAELHEKLAKAGYTMMDHDPKSFFMKFERVAGEDWTGGRLDLTTWRDEVSFMLWILTGFATMRFLLVAALMVIVVVGIMNATWMSIRERTREVGTLRAIGMSRRRVLGMFLWEAVLLGLIATSVGALAGSRLAWGVDAYGPKITMDAFRMVLMSDRLHLQPGIGDALGAIGVITLVTTLAALYPAWKAARMRPVTAMHHVG